MSNRFKLFRSSEDEEHNHTYHSALEKKIEKVLYPFEEFTKSQVMASAFLFICTIIALVWASLPNASYLYQKFVNLHLGFHFEGLLISEPIKFWVNDVLLTLFFFFVGLEIKREFLVGELANHRRALLIVLAALGGMGVPAIIYLLLNYHSTAIVGWGIPMATDTAFAVGVLSCFKKRLPEGIFTFVAALAIIDDIGSIIVIAVYYSEKIYLAYLMLACFGIGLLVFLNYCGIRKSSIYLLIGLGVWILVKQAGVHGTIAGIAVAFTIPARPQRGPRQFIQRTKELLTYFEQRKDEKPLILADKRQHAILEELKLAAHEATTPLQRWETILERPIALIVLPIFALVNAGVDIDFHSLSKALLQPLTWGVILGLFIGKPLGIGLFTWITVKLGIGVLPEQTSFRHIISVALLGGIGFTMSLFMATLGFIDTPQYISMAKIGILLGSLSSGVVGIISLFTIPKNKKEKIQI